MTIGIVALAIGFLWAVCKGCVVWNCAHDLFNGGGPPTLDFPVICSLPLAIGCSEVLNALGRNPFPGFGFVVYLGLVVIFGFLLWLFGRLGEPERQRQLQALQQKKGSVDKPTA
ncbi:hypothetical protein CfE428DRAFT_2895 [Chthoniobacter flavus Ellin428]|uniref:Uncharacterized protein n=1 Tax=Chthoniobacter flavus Ellin428 TaxID=497964 RepID=B4D1V7_9BACT|nr:hypothetical protein [Chthoniobacter flavus]EDY19719.1 hypothetical protein CfE428DRAFT_2895 [Chthoniobacter flavus Ellin428]TCO92950.1 hypothetical protein EV701_105227 [Chthoniobacter flavus]